MNGSSRFDAGDWPTPTELVGRYLLVALARTGRHGSVYRAHDTLRNEAIALKVVHRDLTGDVGTRADLVREVRRARGLCHPNLIPTRDLVLVPTDVGADVLVTTEYVPGRSLARRIREQGPLPIPEVLRIGRSVADALVAAHTAGILHCDVNPEHVLLADDGRVLLTDFGIGRALTGYPPGSAGAGEGPPGFAGGGRGSLDERTDVFGLGVVLATSLVGWTDGLPLDLRGRVPDPIAELVARCLAVDPEQRWGSIAEARAALQAIDDPRDDLLPVAPTRGLGGARVAVVALTAAPELRHLADGVSDEIARSLSMIGGLRVRTGGDRGANDVEVRGELQPDGPDVVLTVRLVTVPSSWRLWIGRFETAGVGLLPCAQRAAGAIARALTSASVPARHPGPTDPEALDLWLRGLHQARQGANDRAAALLELARGRVPDDPRVLAAVAQVRLARTRATPPSGAIDLLLASAERLAREAVARGPELPETHLALAEILRFDGDAVGAAHATRIGLSLAPSSAEARAAAGSLWSEAGDLEACVFHLQQALALDPDRPSTGLDLARAWALLGRQEACELALPAGSSVERARYAMWFPELPTVEPVCDRTRVLAQIRDGRPVSAAAWAALETDERDRRLVAAATELAIEARICAGFEDLAFRRLERAAREGLVDQAWLDRCPVLGPLRADARFGWIRHLVAGRARAIGRALVG